MGELVMAAKVTHVPSIWLSLQPGKTFGIRKAAEDALRELGRRARERGVDTFLIADSHWITSSGFHIDGKARHAGRYASHELPHFIRDLPYAYPGDPELAALVAEEIAANGQKSMCHDVPELGLQYGTLVPMYLMNDTEPAMRVVPMACNMYSKIDENLRVGEAIGRAIARSDRRVAFLASGSLSHDFPTNELTDQYLNKISSEFNYRMDQFVLELWREGRTREFLDMLPEYNVKCVGEVGMVDTAMLFGLLGGAGYTGRGEELCPYFPSTGTGQTVVDFPVPSASTSV